MANKGLSKSKYTKFRQCEKALWLRVYNPELAVEDPQMTARFQAGNEVGDLAMHLDAKSSSGDYHKDSRKFYVRSFATFTLWWRMIYDNPNMPALERFYSCILFIIKVLWLLPINICASIAFKNIKIPYYYTKGVIDGWIFLHSNEYKKIPPYVLRERNC